MKSESVGVAKAAVLAVVPLGVAIASLALGFPAYSSVEVERISTFGGVICPLPGQHPKVMLERQSFWFDLGANRIQTDYLLSNKGSSRRLAVCIPQYWALPHDGEKTIEDWHLRVSVDGRRTPLTRRIVHQATAGYEGRNLPMGSAPNALWIVQVPLRRGQSRRVRVSFVSSGYGHESLLWLLYFPQASWFGTPAATSLKVTAKDFPPENGEVRLFPHGWNPDYKTVPARWHGHRGFYQWQYWKPTGFLMVVEDN